MGQVARVGLNDYEVQTGPDKTIPPTIFRAWWNFHGSVAYQDDISTLDALTLEITTVVGPNLPSAASFDLLQLCPLINARNNAPNPTVQFSDFCQFSQNPEFGWFVATSDTDANPDGDFNYDAPGAWIFNLTAVREDESAEVSICIHTPGEGCGELDEDDDDEDDDDEGA